MIRREIVESPYLTKLITTRTALDLCKSLLYTPAFNIPTKNYTLISPKLKFSLPTHKSRESGTSIWRF